MEKSLTHKTLNGTLWGAIERFAPQCIQFIVIVIMARILTPKDYGLVGMLTIFIAISQSLIDSGFTQAIIRKQERNNIDYSTAFYFNIVISICIYLILFFTAPLIARFYNQPILIQLTRVIGLSVIISAIAIIPRAILTIKIDFKTQTIASIIAAVVAGIVGISMAHLNFGVWSIVGFQISNLFIASCLLCIFVRWRPLLIYSWKSFKELFGFGSKLALSGIIDTTYKNLYLIVIGKLFNANDLGFYTRASQFSEFPSSNISGILQRVTFPVLCSIQNDDEKLKIVYRKFLRISAFVIFPLMTGLAAVAHPLILIILKDKWIYTASLLQILCFAMMWYPVHAINLNLLQVKGRSDLFLKLEIYKKIIGIIILFATVPIGLKAMCYGMILSSLISLAINANYTGKLISLGFVKQMIDLTPSLIYSLSMFGIMIIPVLLISNNWIKLIVSCIVGFVYYFTITKITHSQDLRELLLLIKKK